MKRKSVDIFRKEDAILICFLSFLLLVLVVHATTIHSVNPGANKEITEFSTCKKITNSGSHGIFVPTGSNSEWQAFYDNPPAGISIGNCYVPPAPKCGKWDGNSACRCGSGKVCNYQTLGSMDKDTCSEQCKATYAECCEYSNGVCYKNWGKTPHIVGGFGGWLAAMC